MPRDAQNRYIRQPAQELKHRRVGHNPEGSLIPGVRAPDDEKDEQVVDSRPNKQTDRRANRDQYYVGDQATKRTGEPVARSQRDDESEDPTNHRTDEGADDREEQWVQEVALPADAFEEIYRIQKDFARRPN
jgi:hypothetical protein